MVEINGQRFIEDDLNRVELVDLYCNLIKAGFIPTGELLLYASTLTRYMDRTLTN